MAQDGEERRSGSLRALSQVRSERRLIDADALIEKWYEVNNIGPEDRGAIFIGYTEIPRFINNAPTVEPTGDLISRADAIEAVAKFCVDGYKAKVDGYFIPLTDALINTLSALPSADAVSLEFYEDAVKANIGLVIENLISESITIQFVALYVEKRETESGTSVPTAERE